MRKRRSLLPGRVHSIFVAFRFATLSFYQAFAEQSICIGQFRRLAAAKILGISFVLLAHGLVADSAWSQPAQNLALEVPKGRFIGMPIHWSPYDVALLEPTGRIRVFEAKEVVQHQMLDELFQPQTLMQASLDLQAELGPEFETLVTGPYVIGVPRGEAKRWETRFRSLLAGYVRYFEVRGWPIRKPDFPLTIMVLPTREDFLRFGSKEVEGGKMATNLSGMYVPRTNRCLLYKIRGGSSETNWAATEATIVHEAIHQLAYNTGAHERLFQHPLWFVEGFATMFEVPAVYDSSVQQSTIETRIHHEQIEIIRSSGLDNDHFGAALRQLVADDELFRTRPDAAYALSWAMTFYMVERMPRQYFDYVASQRARGFQIYTAGDRELDFRAAFQTTPDQLAPQIQQLLRLR